MNGAFILRKDQKANEWGELPVYLQYSCNGVAVKAAAGIRVNPADWDAKGGNSNKWVRASARNHADLNARLFKFKKNKDGLIASFPDERAITIPIMRSIMNGTFEEEMERGKGKVCFVDRVLEYNEGLYKAEKISYSVWRNIECNMGLFRKFLFEAGWENRNKTLMCRDISEDVIAQYISWRKARGNSNETINHALTPMFKTLTECSRKGWISRELAESICAMYLPATISLNDDPSDEVRYLTKEQVRRLIDTANSGKYPRTVELLDLFLFSIHACGLRFSDVCTLRWENIDMEKRMLRKYLVKGHTRKNTLLTIPLSDEAIRILRKWEGKYPSFVFGMLPDDFDLTDQALMKKTLNAKNRSMNTSLRTLGDKIGLSFPLHFHVSRHTWATLSLNEGIDIKAISTMMGHSSVVVTEKVYSKFMPETLQMTMDERLNFTF